MGNAAIALRKGKALVGSLWALAEREQGMTVSNAYANSKYACGCSEPGSQCYLDVSQRSLDKITTFSGNTDGGTTTNIPIAATTNIFNSLIIGAEGIFGGLGGPIVFNNANDNAQRGRVAALVLWAIRAHVDVWFTPDYGALATASPNVWQSEEIRQWVLDFLGLRIFHTADQQSPYVQLTSLAYFCRPSGKFVPVPPVKWVDRDPRMELDLIVANNIGAAGVLAADAIPNFTLATADAQAYIQIGVECLYGPDPAVCPDVWPGTLCPPDRIVRGRKTKLLA